MIRYESYANAMLDAKGAAGANAALVERATIAIREAYETVYWAVAFDIDGTLTQRDSPSIAPEMAETIAELLRRSVHVLLISGRGRTSTREAGQAILALSGLSSRYARRLQCITHNGIYWLRTPSDRVDAFLATEVLIAPEFESVQEIKHLVKTDPFIREGLLHEQVVMTEEPTNETYALRIVVRDQLRLEPTEVRARLEEIVSAFSGARPNIVQGVYGDVVSFDITQTSKTKALEYYAGRHGINTDSILRIGDQGQEYGNDFELLNHPRGFSVGSISTDPGRCFPVLDDDCSFRLTGVAATHTLLKRLKLLPPLTLQPENGQGLLRALQVLQRDSLRRTRKESDLLLQRIRIRLNRLIADEGDSASVPKIEYADLFDELSGGVRMRDWEIGDLSIEHVGLRLFNLEQTLFREFLDCRLDWSMFTDSGVLLRGPKYYWGMTHELTAGYLGRYAADAVAFVAAALEVIRVLRSEEPDLLRFKILLGILDNVRNILINLLYAAYVAEVRESIAIGHSSYHFTYTMFVKGLIPHTRVNLDALLSIDVSWRRLLEEYEVLLRALPGLIQAQGPFAGRHEFVKGDPVLLRRWRECDIFLQNVLAIEIGLHELEPLLPSAADSEGRPPVGIGLAYGALELPAIAAVIAAQKGISFSGGLLKLSLYGNEELRKRILEGQVDCSQLVGEQESQLCSLLILEPGALAPADSISERQVVILEDNCTTGRTLQTARDLLARLEADVVGAVVVRYPGTNRFRQMLFPNHGLPDPDILLSFVRGFVAPSPYTRLLNPKREGEHQYLDKSGVFDKSRNRIERYLRKNGSLA